MPDISHHEQGTEEWLRERIGIPTASMFHAVLAKGQGVTRKNYMHRLAAEIITGELVETYSNAAMERGKEQEPDARRFYEMMADVDVDQVGFVRNGRCGCSPDGLIGSDGGLEIKSKEPHLMVDTIMRGAMPPAHKAQVQGSLWVCERDWWDFVAYWPSFPLFSVRVHRDEEYISALAEAVDRFNEELDGVVEAVRSYGVAAE